MNDQTPDQEKQTEPRHSPWATIGVFFSTLAMIVLIGAVGFGYFQFSKINLSLAQKVEELQTKAGQNEKEIETLKTSTQSLEQSLQKSQELSTEQEKLVSEWRAAQKGDVEKWQIAEAQYLVKLANDHLQFTHNTALALTLMQRANQILQNLQDTGLLEIQKALGADIAALQAEPQIDTTGLYVRLNGLDGEINQLPLPENPLKAEDKTTPIPQDLPWWKSGLAHTWQALSKIVIVRDTAKNALPLILPEEKVFLYQNLHAQMESAMWAVLQHNNDVYQASLARSLAWIQLYFDQEAAPTKNILQNIAELQKTNIELKATNLSATLQLFDNYFAQTKTAS